MSEFVNEYKLQCYKVIRSLNETDNLWLTEDSVTGTLFVMRKLALDCREVYETLADIHHQNVIEIVDVFSHNGALYVIEEYLEWEVLSDRIKKEGLADAFVFSAAKQLFSGLSAVHSQGIVHRDVKPENIMINRQGRIKLIDFHIARMFSGEKSQDTCPKGSRDYAAPEQFGFAQTDCRGDIYSAGVTLNLLSTGSLPVERICRGRIGIAVKRCIEFDPARRYQTAQQALNHLKQLEKRRPVRVIVYSLCICLAAGAFFLWESRTSHPAELPLSMKEISLSTEYQDRIIVCKRPENYPAILLTGNKTQSFTADLTSGAKVAVKAKKEKAQLTLILTLTGEAAEKEYHENRNSDKTQNTEFHFADVFSDKYADLGYSINTDFSTTSPEYELLLDDVNQDGKADFLVTLAWRRPIDTPEPENRYYLTEYSTLWLIFQDENSQWTCSEPLYFEGCVPALQTDVLLYDSCQPAWYTFQKGAWHRSY